MVCLLVLFTILKLIRNLLPCYKMVMVYLYIYYFAHVCIFFSQYYWNHNNKITMYGQSYEKLWK